MRVGLILLPAPSMGGCWLSVGPSEAQLASGEQSDLHRSVLACVTEGVKSRRIVVVVESTKATYCAWADEWSGLGERRPWRSAGSVVDPERHHEFVAAGDGQHVTVVKDFAR